jgi:hypothetical protein
MKPNEIFRRLSSDEIDALVLHACSDDEIPDKIAGGVLTYMNMPLARFARLPEPTRRGYVRRTLRDKKAADLALYVLSAGLMQGSPKVMETFLEALGLPHEGPNLTTEGAVPEPKPKALAAAIDSLLKAFPVREASLYLHAFATQPDVDWPSLVERLATDKTLALEDRGQA